MSDANSQGVSIYSEAAGPKKADAGRTDSNIRGGANLGPIGLQFSVQAAEQEKLFQASHGELLQMLQEGLEAQWRAMEDKTVDLGRGFTRMETVLKRLADKYGDTRAAKVHAYMTRLEEGPDRVFRPHLAHYAPRGIPVMRVLYSSFGWKLPRDKLRAVHDAIAREKGAKDEWDQGRAAMGQWMRLTAA